MNDVELGIFQKLLRAESKITKQLDYETGSKEELRFVQARAYFAINMLQNWADENPDEYAEWGEESMHLVEKGEEEEELFEE